MPDVVGRVGGWWKAAAGCAICASLVAGLIQDARYWVWDRTVGYFFPAQATFDTCLSRGTAALQRPEGALYQVIVTVPLGDRDQIAFRQIETSLTRAYGETQSATIRVGALDCEPLKPAAGDSADRLATADARADALLAGTGADAVLWGELFADGRTMELRFAHPRDADAAGATGKAAIYAAGAITLDLNFGHDIGALIAARALDRTLDIAAGDRLDQGEVSARILTLLQPLVAARPPGISDENYAEVLFSEALAAGTAAAAAADGAALLASADRLRAAEALFPADAVAKRDYARIFAALHLGNAASLLPATQARGALIDAIAAYDAVGPRVEALFGPRMAQYLVSDLGLVITLAGVLMPEPERSRWMQDGVARLRQAAVALPEPAILLQFATGVYARTSLSDDSTAIALIVEATAANDRALAGLPEGDRGVIWLRATTLKGEILLHSTFGDFDPDPKATLDQAIVVLSEAVAVARGTAAASDRAKAEGALGWVLVGRAILADDPGEVPDLLARGEPHLRAALTVYSATASPLLYGWTLEALAHASAACARTPGCGDPVVLRAEAVARFADAAEAYRAAGNAEQVARNLAMSDQYRTSP